MDPFEKCSGRSFIPYSIHIWNRLMNWLWDYDIFIRDGNIKTLLLRWYEQIEQPGFKNFNTLQKTMMMRYKTVFNYFQRISTNASAESLMLRSNSLEPVWEGTIMSSIFFSGWSIFMLDYLLTYQHDPSKASFCI